MNQANVDALNALIGVWERDEIDTKYGGYPSLAEWLASHGVLAVDALTDKECLIAAEDEFAAELVDDSTVRSPSKFRLALGRIAKGEAP
jgi:hypothetical protein